MYRRLRLRLTILCALGSLVVLAAMAVVSLLFSLRQLEGNGEAVFRSNVNNVLFYLQGASAVDHTWLAQTEADNDLVIRVEYNGLTLEYDGLVAQREAVSEQARAAGFAAYPALWQEGSAGLGITSRYYSFTGGDTPYRAAAAVLPKGENLYTVVVAKSQAEELATRRELYFFYGLGSFGAALALGLFAWFFSRWAVRPAVLADQKQKEFLSAASHELRSPLAVIALSADSIKTLPEQAPALAQKIQTECGRLSRLVGDLLLLTGGAAGMKVAKSEVSPQTVLLATYERFEGIAGQKGIAMTPCMPTGAMPNAWWDVPRIEQALAVLLDNAISYTPAGGKITLTLQAKKGQALYLVEDSGPGVPPGEREKVFERFYRADAARSKKEHYGLGLSVAKEIATLHGGGLTVGESPVLGGAAFCLALPFGAENKE